MVTWLRFLTCGLIGALACATPAAAQLTLSRDQVSGVATLGVSVGDKERSWVDQGLGKAGLDDRISAGAIIAWRPSLNARIGGLVTASYQSALSPSVALDEAYLTLRPSPRDALRLSGRVGLFYPPISLEHDGSEWSLARSITPSAINSWVAEEVKTAGLELTLRTGLAGRPAGLTVAGFQGNDTSGTLLAFRGWALHDLRATLNSELPLPPVPTMFVGKQAPWTRPIDEVDGRWGVYSRLDVSPVETLDLSVFAYDNNGDRTTVVNGQYAWRTRFIQAGARWTPTPRTEVLFQAMQGETSMGKRLRGLDPADVGFQSVFVLVAQNLGKGAITSRLEQFSIDDRTFKARDNNAEHGWSATLAWTHPVRHRLDLVVEGVFVSSDRPDRARLGEARRQDNVRLTSALRASF